MKYRENLKSLIPYKPGKSVDEIKKEYNIDKIIKLASNENAYGMSTKVKEAIKKIDVNSTYPDNYCTTVREKLANKYNIEKERFIFGNGSVEIIQMLSRVLLDKDDEMITCVPSFQSYNSEAIIQDAKIIEVPLKEYVFDLNGILEKINRNTKLIFITNPNNPTGTIVTEEELREFMNMVPQDVIVVLDEAYAEYVTSNEYPNSIRLVKEFNNICVLKTFSKAYGLAGTRIGYALASNELINELEKVRVPFNVSAFSQKLAEVALDDEEFVENCNRKNSEVLEYMYRELDKLGINYIKSQANFIMIDMNEDSNIAFEKLLKKGFIVRPGFPKMDTWLRVTIGTQHEMEQFIHALSYIYL